MTGIISYKTPQDYLDATEEFLLQHELENNLILGLCNGFPDKRQEYKGVVFINFMNNGSIQATSIKTWVKAIVSGIEESRDAIKPLADYYLNNNIHLVGVAGKTFFAQQFTDCFNRPQLHNREMLIHQLTTVKKQPLAPGKMIPAEDADLDLVTDWTLNFERDCKAFPIKKREQVLESTKGRLAKGDIFKWVDNGEAVSICAIVRKTRNFGIVGLVYTPDELRGRGYATSCVQALSEHILQSGFRYCGLFTEKANPVSNGIYRKIGYEALSEFSDIEFGG